ncbi:hypothetical protein G3A39_41220 [Paraburkholderia aspalathi]|nr:hypothetical protein [Paraburkholderia aspalathi]
MVLWSGWEGDSCFVRIRLPDGRAEVVFADQMSPDFEEDLEGVLRERMVAYMDAIEKTQAFLGELK